MIKYVFFFYSKISNMRKVGYLHFHNKFNILEFLTDHNYVTGCYYNSKANVNSLSESICQFLTGKLWQGRNLNSNDFTKININGI